MLELSFKKPRVYRDRKDDYIRRCVELENDNRTLRLKNEMLSAELTKTEYLLRAERASAANIGFGTLVKRWWMGRK